MAEQTLLGLAAPVAVPTWLAPWAPPSLHASHTPHFQSFHLPAHLQRPSPPSPPSHPAGMPQWFLPPGSLPECSLGQPPWPGSCCPPDFAFRATVIDNLSDLIVGLLSFGRAGLVPVWLIVIRQHPVQWRVGRRNICKVSK